MAVGAVMVACSWYKQVKTRDVIGFSLWFVD